MGQIESSARNRDRLGDRGGYGLDPQASSLGKKPANAYAGIRQNAATLAQDFIRLVDLQIQLLTIDLSDFWLKSRVGIALIVIGGTTMLAAIPVLLLGLAELLHTQTRLTLEGAQLTVGAVALLTGGLFLWISLQLLTKASTSLDRSRAELKSNMDWLRSVLSGEDD